MLSLGHRQSQRPSNNTGSDKHALDRAVALRCTVLYRTGMASKPVKDSWKRYDTKESPFLELKNPCTSL